MKQKSDLLCPSAQHDWEDARLFAVMGGTPENPEAAYLDQTQPITEELLKMTEPVSPSEVFRFSAPCAQGKCGHYDNDHEKCKLVAKTVRLTEVVVQKLARCAIRSECRWWSQEGAVACQRCPQVVTTNFAPSNEMKIAADVSTE